MKNFIVFGDLHLESKISYKKSPYFKGSLSTDYRSMFILKHIKEICRKYTHLDDLHIVFLGDIYDDESGSSVKSYNYFNILLEDLIGNFSNISEIHILVGNHDTEKVEDPSETFLYMLNNKSNKVRVYYKLTVTSIPEYDYDIVFFPYVKKEHIAEKFDLLNQYVKRDYILFSHLDIALSDSIFNIPTVNLNTIKHGNLLYIFNGHIHKGYSNTNFINTGACAPWRFNEDEQGKGTVVYNNGEIIYHQNNYINYIDCLNITDLSEVQKKLETISLLEQKICYIRFSKDIDDDIIKKILEQYPFIEKYTFKKENHQNTAMSMSIQNIKNMMNNEISEEIRDDDGNVINLSNNIKETFIKYLDKKYNNRQLQKLFKKLVDG